MPPTPEPLPEAYLVVVGEGGSRDVYRITRPDTLIGRSADCHIVLNNPRVSRHHARLSWDGERFTIADLGSKNGSLVNNSPAAGAVAVHDGDVISLADSRIEFQVSAPTVALTPAANAGPLAVDTVRHEVRLRGETVPLTPKEYLLLALLHGRGGAVVSRDDIAAEVWPELSGDVAEESIVQLVTRLRRKIEDDPANPTSVLTVRGFGYRLAVPPVDEP